MNVLISGHEICGLIHDLAEELKREGHTVTTVAMPHRFFPYTYDFDQYDFPVSFMSRRFGLEWFWRLAFRVLWELKKDWHKALETRLRVRLARTADLYIRVWANIPFDHQVLAALDGTSTKVVSFLMGSDVRDFQVFVKQYGIDRWQFPAECHTPSLDERLRSLRVHERFADVLLSVPDQMGLALRPYSHLQVPLVLSRFNFNIPGREVPLVVHAPSAPYVKGTDLIEETLARLSAAGIAFEFLSLREMSHEELLRVLADADVLVDELVMHGPGWLSFEAMASGCAVATRYLGSSPACFRPPLIAIDEHNIAESLRHLLTNRDLRLQLAVDGRRYIEMNNGIDHIVEDLLLRATSDSEPDPDYVPTYLRDEYVPASPEEIAVINDATVLVSGEVWYSNVASGHSHDGLVF